MSDDCKKVLKRTDIRIAMHHIRVEMLWELICKACGYNGMCMSM